MLTKSAAACRVTLYCGHHHSGLSHNTSSAKSDHHVSTGSAPLRQAAHPSAMVQHVNIL